MVIFLLILLLIIFTIGVFLTIFLISGLITSITNIYQRKILYENLPGILTILDIAKNEAYEKIFKDHILVHTHSKVKVSNEDVLKYMNEYIELVILYAGENIISDLEKIQGSEEAVYSILGIEFIRKVIQDDSISNENENEIEK